MASLSLQNIFFNVQKNSNLDGSMYPKVCTFANINNNERNCKRKMHFY